MELERWLIAFAATQIVEVPIYAAAQPGRPWARRLWVGVLASTLTHPLVSSLGFVLRDFLLHVVVGETFAVAVEALWLRRHGVERAFWWALTANAASVATFIFGRSLVRALTG